MRTITSAITIERPIDEVFAFVTDARNNLLWQTASGLKAIQQVPDAHVGVGTRITEVREVMGRAIEDHSEVTAYEPNRRYARSQIGGSGPFTWGEFTFEPVVEGARWSVVIHLQAGEHAPIDEALFVTKVQRSIQTDMAAAKALLERRVVENAR